MSLRLSLLYAGPSLTLLITTMVFMTSLVFTDLSSLKSDSVWSSIFNYGWGPLWPLLPIQPWPQWLFVSVLGGVSHWYHWGNWGLGWGHRWPAGVSHWFYWIFYSEPQVRVRPTLWVSKCLWCPVPSVCSGLYYYTILRGSKSQPLITKKRWKKSEFFGWPFGSMVLY